MARELQLLAWKCLFTPTFFGVRFYRRVYRPDWPRFRWAIRVHQYRSVLVRLPTGVCVQRLCDLFHARWLTCWLTHRHDVFAEPLNKRTIGSRVNVKSKISLHEQVRAPYNTNSYNMQMLKLSAMTSCLIVRIVKSKYHTLGVITLNPLSCVGFISVLWYTLKLSQSLSSATRVTNLTAMLTRYVIGSRASLKDFDCKQSRCQL